MSYQNYLHEFKKAAAKLDQTLLQKKRMEVAVVEVLHSVCLKLYKKQWANPCPNPLIADTRIFFSVWISDAAIKEQKIQYNIHAFKLRQLKGYKIQSRQFADAFRQYFKAYAHQWPNASVQYGPLTLMEGWVTVNLEDFSGEILKLANKFLAIEHLVDDTLAHFKP